MPTYESVHMQHLYGTTIFLRFECGKQSFDSTFGIGRIALLPTDHHDFALAKAGPESWSIADGDTRPPFPNLVPSVYKSWPSNQQTGGFYATRWNTDASG